jgi:hypothetical protein
MAIRFLPSASATSFVPNFEILSTDVQAAILEALALARTYADQVASGLDPKEAVMVATDAPLPGTVSYTTVNQINSDAALGVIDGTYTPVNGERILVKDQVASQYNGIYVVTSAAAPFKLTRSADADNSPGFEVTSGMYAIAIYGAHGATGWVLLAADPIVLNTTPLPFGILCMADAASVTNTPSGNILATTVQAAIDELDTEKLSTVLGAFGSAPDAKGASVSGQTLTMQPADATRPGMISAGTQSIGGAKSFSHKISANAGIEVIGGITTLSGGAILTGRVSQVPLALTSTGGSMAINALLGNNFYHTTTENTVLAAPSNAVAGQFITITITQGATPRTLTYNAFWKFPQGYVPPLTAVVGAVDTFFAYVEQGATQAVCRIANDRK